MSGTYSFLDVQASLTGIGGSINLGYGAAVAEEGITIASVGDKNKMIIGSDGEGMNTLLADKSATYTIRLLQTSPINQQLMALYDAQSLSSAGWGANVIVISNSNSGDVTTGRQCAFKKKPDLNYKKEGAFHEWVFDVVKSDTVLGVYQ